MNFQTPNHVEEYDSILHHNQGLGQLFYSQVQQNPEAIAICDCQSSLTYHQLHRQAFYLAQQLLQQTISLEEPVGIVAQHGISDVVAQLAIIYAGGSCAPMDPSLPDHEIARSLQALKAQHILVDHENEYRALPFRLLVLKSLKSEEPGQNPTITDLEHRTHLIHTSGTTSKPKAVQITARSILQVVFHAPFEPLDAADVIAYGNSSSFDVALFDIWAPLLRGARIVVLRKTILLDPPALAEHIGCLGITVMVITMALLNLAASAYATEPKT